MSTIRYGTPFWLDQFPRSRRPSYPRHRGHLESDVAIVGGGLTGCATAYAFAAAGVKVALFEADGIGRASTAASSGLLRQEPDPDFRDLAQAFGLRTARSIWQATRRAAFEGAATLRRLNIRLVPQDSIRLATDRDAATRLRRECEARRAAGLEAIWITGDRVSRDTGIAGWAGVRLHGNAQIDPYRASLGLAAAAAARGARIFERSPVVRVRGGRKAVEMKTEGGTVRADRVVIASGHAAPMYQPLARHLKTFHTYLVVTPPLPAAIRRELGTRDAMLRDTESPPHALAWLHDDRVLFGGAAQPRVPERARPRVVVQRTGQLMYELSRLYPAISGIQPDYGWDVVYGRAVDGVPLIGPHRNYGRHSFAWGSGANGVTSAFLASRILLRQHLGDATRDDDWFGFDRIPR